MTTTQQPPEREPPLSDVIARLESLTKDVERLSSDIERRDTQTDKWQDRTWDAVKWVSGISAGLSISAAIALLGILIRAAMSGS